MCLYFLFNFVRDILHSVVKRERHRAMAKIDTKMVNKSFPY
ncbi:hypothetical protein IMCC12053_914 [Celeribacter marinus]|uniref:Uncharacterized protein n=1 Tax=Celeribacter marinus TaxID=1397108 RepID=A0A0P0A9T8_9RHOB|nr:hypothetical protein IMCC12053_914 [Celeribacter marinus]